MTDDERKAAGLLRTAADLTEEALGSLDLRHRLCEGCRRVHHENMSHKRLYDQLETTPFKMRRAAAFLEGSGGDARLGRHRADAALKRSEV